MNGPQVLSISGKYASVPPTQDIVLCWRQDWQTHVYVHRQSSWLQHTLLLCVRQWKMCKLYLKSLYYIFIEQCSFLHKNLVLKEIKVTRKIETTVCRFYYATKQVCLHVIFYYTIELCIGNYLIDIAIEWCQFPTFLLSYKYISPIYVKCICIAHLSHFKLFKLFIIFNAMQCYCIKGWRDNLDHRAGLWPGLQEVPRDLRPGSGLQETVHSVTEKGMLFFTLEV